MVRGFLLLLCLFGVFLSTVERSWAADNTAQLEELVRRADAQLQSGMIKEALDTATKAVQLRTDFGPGHAALGRVYTHMERYDDAVRSFLRARQLGVDVLAQLGAAYYYAGDLEKAASVLTEATTKSREKGDAWYFLGLTRLREKRYDDARTAFSNARKADPSLASETLYFSGVAAVRKGDRDTARAELEQAIEASPYSDSAEAARELLARLDGGMQSTFEFMAGLRGELDSNVLLLPSTSGLFTEEEISNSGGSRIVLDLNGAWKPSFSDSFGALVSYGLYQSIHVSNRDELKRFDLTNHALTAGIEYGDDANYFALPSQFSIAFLGPIGGDYGLFSSTHALNPVYARRFGQHGVGIGNALSFENFDEDPAPVDVQGVDYAQTRDNMTNDLSVFYSYYFAGDRGYVTPSLGWITTNADGENSSWSYDGWHIGTQVGWAFHEHWTLGGVINYVGRSYENPYPLPTAEGGHRLTARSDDEFYLGADLAYRRDWWGVKAAYNWIVNGSTVELFDYSRSIFSLGLETRF